MVRTSLTKSKRNPLFTMNQEKNMFAPAKLGVIWFGKKSLVSPILSLLYSEKSPKELEKVGLKRSLALGLSLSSELFRYKLNSKYRFLLPLQKKA